MSCRKKSYGRFAAIQLESDNCRKGKEYIPIWKKDFSGPGCLDVVKEDCSREVVCKVDCDPVAPCNDYTCRNVAPCVPGCDNLCSNPCEFAPSCHDIKHVAVDECANTQPCGSKLCGRFPVYELNSGAYGKLAHQHNPCSCPKPCHDIKKIVFKKIRNDCRGLQPCDRVSVGRFPFFRVQSGAACRKPDCDYFCDY